MHIVEQCHPYWKTVGGFAKILCPTDFSVSANHAIENAICLPGVREVLVQHVVSSFFEQHPHWSTLFDVHESQKHLDGYVEAELAKVALPESVSYRAVISKGKAFQQITDLAETERVDAIIMGPAKGVTTELVIHSSSRPVLVIPANGGHRKSLAKISKILVETDSSPDSKMITDYAFQLKCLLRCDWLLHDDADPFAVDDVDLVVTGANGYHIVNTLPCPVLIVKV